MELTFFTLIGGNMFWNMSFIKLMLYSFPLKLLRTTSGGVAKSRGFSASGFL